VGHFDRPLTARLGEIIIAPPTGAEESSVIPKKLTSESRQLIGRQYSPKPSRKVGGGAITV